MKLLDRYDGSLAVALIVGVATMFGQPLRSFLSIAEDVSRTYRVDLIPGLLIFVLVYTVHFWRRYRDAETGAKMAARDAAQARDTAEAMERLVAASRAMGGAADRETLKLHAQTHLPLLLPSVPLWVALHERGVWTWLLAGGPGTDDILDAAPDLARRVEGEPSAHHEWTVFPVGTSTGVVGLLGLGLAGQTLPAAETARVRAIGAIIGVAARNVQLFEELQTSSATDSLTGCVNRGYAFETLTKELRRSRRTASPITVLMLDVNGFKAINETFGHAAGDRLLTAIGSVMHQSLRISDVKCRYGGDEFLIVLPDTPAEGARLVVENLRRAIAAVRLSEPAGLVACTVSVGMAVAESGELDPAALVNRADKGLYDEKRRRARAAAAPAVASKAPREVIAATGR